MDVTIICVGDELLTGDVEDLNSTWLARQLAEAGALLVRIVVVPDLAAEIAAEIERSPAGKVIVTGGLGPTHDDVTRFGIARAAGVPLVRVREAVAVVERAGKLAPEAYVMADLPAGAAVIRNPVGAAPGFVVDGRIYAFPGVPAELKAMFPLVKADFAGLKTYVDWLLSRRYESDLVAPLNEAVARFPAVSFGSYPADVVRIKLKSPDPEAIRLAKEWLAPRL